ncbi:MAG: hypothetical protein NVSMB32_18020 [Actinomycetota bacterium]
MGREEVHQEMKALLGQVMSTFDRVPDEFIDSEWDLTKRLALEETLLPCKYKALIGLAVAAVAGSRHSTLLHTESARLSGASDSEIEETARYTRFVLGWIVYLNGLQIDYEEFAHEVAQAVTFRASNAQES